jgi:hypothetical protein
VFSILNVYWLHSGYKWQVSTGQAKLLPRDADEDLSGGHVDDMTKLTYLNEPGVLYNLKRRYALNEIYVGALSSLNFALRNHFRITLY